MLKRKCKRKKIYPVYITDLKECMRIVKENKLMNTFKMTLVIVGTQYLDWRRLDGTPIEITLEKIINRLIIPPPGESAPYREKRRFLEWLKIWRYEFNRTPEICKQQYLDGLKMIRTTL